ncbi:cytochrome b/b6 domain-containing protein [Variovorax sp. OV329]|uniref:cytochrome b/b6 domain-containing protein n=1 Tax=Variovorax sp. OV329 TaxID=1882825 RepID=UPI0008F2AB27|nr:cytochrome b/b6 domain-containing protein [Variovorax sp. OV329]SFM96588.1 Cytochrome b [Variovorax sp. OV329]
MPKPFALSTGFAELDAGAALRVRVWDLPTRVFHWALALAVVGQITTGLLGIMEWHFRIGYLVLSLLLFRLLWGFVGGHWSRFASFLHSPATLRAYLRGEAHPDLRVGHTPLGALSVFAMLAFLVAQVATGLVSDDEVSASGPLTRFVSSATVSLASKWHGAIGAWVILALVVLHVVAIVFYVAVRRQHLVRPMVSGDKFLEHEARPSRDGAGARLLALIIFALCAAFAYWISSLRV